MPSIATPVRITSPSVPPSVPRKSPQASRHKGRRSHETNTSTYGMQVAEQLGYEIGQSAAQQWPRLSQLNEYKGMTRTQYRNAAMTNRTNLLVQPAYSSCFETGFAAGFDSVYRLTRSA